MWRFICLQHEICLGFYPKTVDRSASAVGLPHLSHFWCFLQCGTICFVCVSVFEVMFCAFILCGPHRVFKLLLGSFVTYAVIYCHNGSDLLLFDYSLVSNHARFSLTFPTQSLGSCTGDILTLTDHFKISMEDTLLYLSSPPLSAGPRGSGVYMTHQVTLCFVSSFPSGFQRKRTLPLKATPLSI